MMEQLDQNTLCRSRLEWLTDMKLGCWKNGWQQRNESTASVVPAETSSRYTLTHTRSPNFMRRHLKTREHIDIPHMYRPWQLHSKTLSEELDTRHRDAGTKLLWSRGVTISITKQQGQIQAHSASTKVSGPLCRAWETHTHSHVSTLGCLDSLESNPNHYPPNPYLYPGLYPKAWWFILETFVPDHLQYY